MKTGNFCVSNSRLQDFVVFGRGLGLLTLVALVISLPDWKLTYGYFYRGDFRKADGVVTAAYVEYFPKRGKWGTSKYCPLVQYEYSVDGHRFVSERQSFSGGLCGSKEKCLKITNTYPAGSRVTVFYVPNHPDMAALRPYERNWTRAGALALPLLFAVAMVSLLLSVWAGRELRRRSCTKA